MRRVAIAAAADLAADHQWDASAGDLALAVTKDLHGLATVDAMFVAAPSALLVDRQANVGAVLADRLCLSRGLTVHQLEAGDASGAAALHAAYAQVAAGLSRAALVIGVAKVSDRSERDRGALLDALVDREAEGTLGLSYGALAGLLADLYLQRHGLKASAFAHVVAKNAANAFLGGETFLPHAPSAQEIVRDLPVAPPLVRSDFAPLMDGATAVVVSELGFARELGPTPVEILAVASATDTSVVAERSDPLRLEAVALATAAASKRAGVSVEACSYVDVDSACTILEVLALESLGVTPPGKTGALSKDGFGRVGHARVVNPGGGAQGRGLTLGVAGLAQAREAFLQLGPGAGKRQVAGAAKALSVSIAGLGAQAFTTIYGRHES